MKYILQEQDKAENHYESDNKASMPESNVEKYVTDGENTIFPVVEICSGVII